MTIPVQNPLSRATPIKKKVPEPQDPYREALKPPGYTDELGQGMSIDPALATPEERTTRIIRTGGGRSGGTTTPPKQQTTIPTEIKEVIAKDIITTDRTTANIRQKQFAELQRQKGIKADQEALRQGIERQNLDILAGNPQLYWTSKLSFSDPLGMRSAFAIGYGLLQGKTERQIADDVIKLHTDYIEGLQGANKTIPGGAFTKQAIETGLIVGPSAVLSAPVTGLKSAIANIGARGFIRGMQGYHIGRTIKDPTPENLFFAIAPILGEAGIRAYGRLPAVQKRALIKQTATYGQKIKGTPTRLQKLTGKYYSTTTKSGKIQWYKKTTLPKQDIAQLKELLDLADEYAKVSKPTVLKNINLKRVVSKSTGARTIPDEAIPIIKKFIKEKGLIVGGTVSNEAQMTAFRNPHDIDLYGNFATTKTQQLIQALKKKGIRAGQSGKDITIAGKKAIQIHEIAMLKENTRLLSPYLTRKVSGHITKTPDGIKILKLTTQMKRKLIGSYADNLGRYTKDFPDFEAIMDYINRPENYRITKGRSEPVIEKVKFRIPKKATGGFKTQSGDVYTAYNNYDYSYSKPLYSSYYITPSYSSTSSYATKSHSKYEDRYSKGGTKEKYTTNTKPKGGTYPSKNKEKTIPYPNVPPSKKEYFYTLPSQGGKYPPVPYTGSGTGVGLYPIVTNPPKRRRDIPSISRKAEDETRNKKRKFKKMRWQLVQDPFLRFLGKRKYSRGINLLKAQKQGNFVV